MHVLAFEDQMVHDSKLPSQNIDILTTKSLMHWRAIRGKILLNLSNMDCRKKCWISGHHPKTSSQKYQFTRVKRSCTSQSSFEGPISGKPNSSDGTSALESSLQTNETSWAKYEESRRQKQVIRETLPDTV